jgi:hypothetical protein
VSKHRATLDWIWPHCAGRCHWCDGAIRRTEKGEQVHNDPTIASVDHVFSRHDERRRKPSARAHFTTVTAVVACQRCNQERGARPYDEFLMIKRPEWRMKGDERHD